MTQSISEFQHQIGEHLENIKHAHDRLVEHDNYVDRAVEELDTKTVALQTRLSEIVAERVITDTYLASLGYPIAKGRNRIKVDVEPREVPVEQLSAYLSEILSDLQTLSAAEKEHSAGVDSLKEERESLYRDFALVVSKALDSQVITRQQIEAFGIKLPTRAYLKRLEKEQQEARTADTVETTPEDYDHS